MIRLVPIICFVVILLFQDCICQDSGDLRSSVTRKPAAKNATSTPPVEVAEESVANVSTRGYDPEGLSDEGLPDNCGNSKAPHSRIVGGRPAKRGAWPWIAAIGYKSYRGNVNYFCGGALISDRFVVTASHCVYEKNNVHSVRLGEFNLMSDDDGVNPVDIEIAEVIMHPEYNPRTTYNDITLLRLRKRVRFSPEISPICLPSTQALQHEQFDYNLPFVAGWGSTHFGGGQSAVLQEVQIPVVPVTECTQNYKLQLGVQIDDTQICAGLRRGKKDSCQGDSGGPLMQPVGDKYVLIGVVSYGYKCAEPGFPGIYARITHHLEWMESVMHGYR